MLSGINITNLKKKFTLQMLNLSYNFQL